MTITSRRRVTAVLAVLVPFVAHARGAEPAPSWELRDGDRVVAVGNTLVERARRYGYLETAITRCYPQANVTFRNLGWSGDTVFGHARAGFDSEVEGFERLVEQVAAAEPSVLIVGYGSNEAFDGADALPRFVDGLNRLLDRIATGGVRLVFLSPIKLEDLGRPLPDPAEHNRVLRLYADAIRDVAAEREGAFIDLFEGLRGSQDPPVGPLTDDGMHLTGFGYWRLARAIGGQLSLPTDEWTLDIDAPGQVGGQRGVQIQGIEGSADWLRFAATDDCLPPAPAPDDAPSPAPAASPRVMRIAGLPAGTYELRIDGQLAATATAAEWTTGVKLAAAVDAGATERLRQAIIEKNRLFFYRWRPQNVTYLFGFRKHEQGQNAIEVPKFDPLVAEQEAVIADLRVPRQRVYELRRQKRG